MLIKCPQCQTVYRLESNRLPPNGLKMRCAKCRCVWRARAEEEEKTAAPDTHTFDTDAFLFAFRREVNKERMPLSEETTAPTAKAEALTCRQRRKKTLMFLLILLLIVAIGSLCWRFRAQLKQLPEEFSQSKEQAVIPLRQQADRLFSRLVE